MGDFDVNGSVYTPTFPDDGKLKQILDANVNAKFNYPESVDITGDFILKPFKYNYIQIQPLAGSSCRVAWHRDR